MCGRKEIIVCFVRSGAAKYYMKCPVFEARAKQHTPVKPKFGLNKKSHEVLPADQVLCKSKKL